MVAPMLTSGPTDQSNFWFDLSNEEDFYKIFFPIYKRRSLGCFKVFGLQDCYLLDLKDKQIEFLLDGSSNTDADAEFSAQARSQSKT